MPQTTRRGVAPLNLQPRWHEGYLTVKLRDVLHIFTLMGNDKTFPL